ncbi:MAG: DNA repair protein RecO [Planctomycetes bacterium]|nr:DNA repair protein RecO [Planctomycetota bacterium]
MSATRGGARRKDRALVLRRFRYSESSLVVHVLAREHGRVALLARGAFRPRSRFFAVLDLFDELQLEWTARRGQLEDLVAGELVVRRRGVTRDLDAYAAGLSMLELTHLGSRPAHAEPELFDELTRGLDRLHARGCGSGPPADAARVAFELAFLRLHGLAPALTSCAACGGAALPLEGGAAGHRAWFSAGAGGRLCHACATEARAAGRRVGTLPLDVLAAADRMVAAEEHGAPLPEVPPARLERVRDFVERFLDYHLETRPRSHRRFLEHENRNAPTPR